jgi:hypothetical protein
MYQKDNPINQCNLKFDGEDQDNYKFSGYLTAFDSNDNVNDTIRKGAFIAAEGKSFPLFVNHSHKEIPIGSFSGKEDDFGFFIEAEINKDHHLGKSVYTALKRGDIKGLSQGFTLKKGDFEEKSEGGKDIKNLSLMEGSVVTFPCEEKAQITAVKHDIDQLSELKDCENYLRDACGLSRSMARAFVSHVKAFPVRDAQEDRDEISKSILQAINQLKGII